MTTSDSNEKSRQLLLSLFETAIDAARPSHILSAYLPPPPKNRLVIIAIGKAAAAMAAEAERHYAGHPIEGIALTRHGHSHGITLRHIALHEAGHPVPDHFGETASRKIMELASELSQGDLALVLISGGGSALASLPLEGISLSDKQNLTRDLLASGAPIQDINTVRKHLSLIKGGRLAKALYPASIITLAISDVAGDKPSIIASGPTVPDPTTRADALTVLKKWNVEPPANVLDAMSQATETPDRTDPVFADTSFTVIASGAVSLKAAAEVARKNGYDILDLGDRLGGEARDVARHHAALALNAKAQGRKLAILSGGEVSVTFEKNGPDTPRGGPNQEYALALAITLKGTENICALAGDTDGIDGGSGAADDPAGAMVFPDTLRRASVAGHQPTRLLEAHASGSFFASLGDLVQTGPSHTNVNDFRIILVG